MCLAMTCLKLVFWLSTFLDCWCEHISTESTDWHIMHNKYKFMEWLIKRLPIMKPVCFHIIRLFHSITINTLLHLFILSTCRYLFALTQFPLSSLKCAHSLWYFAHELCIDWLIPLFLYCSLVNINLWCAVSIFFVYVKLNSLSNSTMQLFSWDFNLVPHTSSLAQHIPSL